MGTSQELETWLRKEAADRKRKAESRRGDAKAGLNLTDEDREVARQMAEQMSGRRLPKTTRAQDDEYAKIQERIAAKLENEAARILLFAAYVSSMPADWLVDSSLETWFPFTAEELGSLKTKVAEQAATIERLMRLVKNEYCPWGSAGGLGECKHGYAARLHCYQCDYDAVFNGLGLNQQGRP
jgi:hypothetical protein